jgi:hypothetical protein
MRWLSLLVALAIGCAGRSGTRGGGPAAAGDRFERIHRLIDLYDTARFAHDEKSRAALGRELGVEVGTGPAATDRVIAALLVEVDKLLAADRLHGGAQAARTLLEFDGKPPAARAEVLQRMTEVKAIARGRGPLAPNARLRLAGYCWRALDDATRAPWRQRHFAVAHCLYALYDSDPDPYFARDPDRRPPLPPWQDLVAASRSLLPEGPLGGAALREALSAIEKRADEMPVEPVADAMEPPEQVAAAAPLYDWAPVVEPGASVNDVRERIQGDGRGQVALRLAPNGKGDIGNLAATAGTAGANEVQVLVARKQKLEAPAGDYWHGKAATVTRAAIIPISLLPLGKPAATGSRTHAAVDFASGVQLTLVLGPTRWRLLGTDGELWVGNAADSRDLQLRATLVAVRRAFPDQQALALVVDSQVTNAEVMTAAAAAAFTKTGAPFFRLGLAAKAPAVKGNGLARRVKLRAGASVAVMPDTLAARKPALLACYQDAVEKAPALAGVVRLEPKNGAAAVTGKADKRLAACATRALGRALIDSGATSAEVTFRVSESR